MEAQSHLKNPCQLPVTHQKVLTKKVSIAKPMSLLAHSTTADDGDHFQQQTCPAAGRKKRKGIALPRKRSV